MTRTCDGVEEEHGVYENVMIGAIPVSTLVIILCTRLWGIPKQRTVVILSHSEYAVIYGSAARRETLIEILENLPITHDVDIDISCRQSRVRAWAKAQSKEDGTFERCREELQNVVSEHMPPVKLTKKRCRYRSLTFGPPKGISMLLLDFRQRRIVTIRNG